jgi:glutathione synthase/RimK-type ligase-like ATP-grasp enzyme
MILIATAKSDVHPTSVVGLMKERNIPFFRLNTECLMTDYQFAWVHNNGTAPDFYIKDINSGKEIMGHEVSAVWCRRPDKPSELPFSVSKEVDEFNMEVAKRLYMYLMFYLMDCYSIGNFLYDRRANSKMLQSKVAAELGMKVAPTCLSNMKERIVQFAQPFDSVGIKSLSNYWLRNEKNQHYDLSTQKVSTARLTEQPDEAYSQTVSFVQQYIEKKYELRVTVMGSYIFTCKLDSQSLTADTGAIDWRQGYDYGLKHEMIDTPEVIASFCREYLRRFNLNFGCFDFIVTPEDEYVFLECNPNGQWGWIEDECHVPMSEALLDCLVNRITV